MKKKTVKFALFIEFKNMINSKKTKKDFVVVVKPEMCCINFDISMTLLIDLQSN